MINPKPKRKKLSRRQFTRLMLTGAIGGTVVVAELASRPLGLIKWFSIALRRTGKSFGDQSKVAIVNAPSYEVDLVTPLRSAWDLLELPAVTGKKVVLKPNIFYNIPDHPVNTNAAVIDAAIQLLQEKGAASIIVAEGTAYQRDITDLLYSSEIGTMLEMRGIRFVDLNHDDVVKVPTKGGYTTRENTWLPRTIAEADLIISMPKMKTHHWAGATLSMKNLYGVVPGLKYGWPKNTLHMTGIETSIVELYETIAPQMAIVDGIVGMEEDGPLFGQTQADECTGSWHGFGGGGCHLRSHNGSGRTGNGSRHGQVHQRCRLARSGRDEFGSHKNFGRTPQYRAPKIRTTAQPG